MAVIGPVLVKAGLTTAVVAVTSPHLPLAA